MHHFAGETSDFLFVDIRHRTLPNPIFFHYHTIRYGFIEQFDYFRSTDRFAYAVLFVPEAIVLYSSTAPDEMSSTNTECVHICSYMTTTVGVNLVPRLFGGEEKKEPSTH